MIDLRRGELFAIQDTTTVYQCGFDGIRFIELQIDTNQKFSAMPNTSPANDIIVVSRETQLMNELKLYNGVKHININSRNKTILNLVQGTPGCGKTTFILTNYKIGDLVVFPTREGAEYFRLRYRNLHPDCSKDTANDSFRTLHSSIINSTKHINIGNKYNRLIIDEALMIHSCWRGPLCS